MADWYYLLNGPSNVPSAGAQMGPAPWDDLQAAFSSGGLSDQSMVWGPGLSGWTAIQDAPDLPLLATSPRGAALTQRRVRELARGPGAIILCGRFEGLDQRVVETRNLEEVSIGDFILSGGEPAAITLIDACVRLLPGIMGKSESQTEESFENGLLEHPQFTRPQDWNGRSVPEVLLSGHHENIRNWRQAEAETITKTRRPDLWDRHQQTNAGST